MATLVRHLTPYSGRWYPGDRSRLNALLDELFERSAARTGPGLLAGGLGFVVPHAGLIYSGTVAAAVYRHLAQQPPRTVVLLGFTHQGCPPGAWIPPVESYQTPLGELAVDRDLAGVLLSRPGFGSLREEILCDHSIEIQLPLLQRAVPEASVVPIYVSSLSPAMRRQAAAALAELLTPERVLVASSDFTHYGDSFRYKPFATDAAVAKRLEKLDEGFIEAAGSLDPERFLEALEAERGTVCGREPIALLLETLRALPAADDIFQMTLDYQTSGEITGDYSHSVSYAALGYFPWSSYLLAEPDQQVLLESARATLRHYQETGRPEPMTPRGGSPALLRRLGAFVTLHQQGRLRGCVGRCTNPDPLASAVPRLTLAAALEDTRFPPVRPEETDLEVEISILSPLKWLPEPSRFEVHRDGGYLRTATRSGLLLPQVAEGRNWTARDFLEALAQKAGCSPKVYEDPQTRLSVFRAQVIQ
jgi:AmmeMemoRadiSam system protein B/AmmeMemoRadiSam system protein A